MWPTIVGCPNIFSWGKADSVSIPSHICEETRRVKNWQLHKSVCHLKDQTSEHVLQNLPSSLVKADKDATWPTDTPLQEKLRVNKTDGGHCIISLKAGLRIFLSDWREEDLTNRLTGWGTWDRDEYRQRTAEIYWTEYRSRRWIPS